MIRFENIVNVFDLNAVLASGSHASLVIAYVLAKRCGFGLIVMNIRIINGVTGLYIAFETV